MIRSDRRRQALFAAVATFAMALTLILGAAPRPASADGAASTRNIILAGAAVAAGIIVANNVAHKNAAYNTVVGTTRDGGTVYADGRVVYPNGDTLYASNGNGRPCGYYNGVSTRCSSNAVAYYPQNYRGHRHDNGNHYGWMRGNGNHYGWMRGNGNAGYHDNHSADRDDRSNGYHNGRGDHDEHGDHGDHNDNGNH